MNSGMFDGFNRIRSDRFFREKVKAGMRAAVRERRKRRSRRRRAALIAVPAAAAVAAALILPGVLNGGLTLPAKAQDLMQGVKARRVDVSGAVTPGFLRATQRFSADLFKAQYRRGENNLISPASAYFCLGMVANGAGGGTRSEFLNVLGGGRSLTMKALDGGYKAYADDLAARRGSTETVLSNSIWLKTGLNVRRDFLQSNADYFGAGARTLDFDSPGAVKTINGWVKSRTKGRIDGLIDRIDPGDRMFLLNALTFDGKWKTPFGKDVPTTEGDFHKEDGAAVQTLFMYQTEKLGYVKGAREEAAVLPYDDGRFGMVCILPAEGTPLKDYVAGLTENTLPELLGKRTDAVVSLSLPKFTVKADKTLNEPLKTMGLAGAFDPYRADFTGMTGDRSLYVAEVKQKTFLQVDELGTKAAAATEARMTKTAAVLSDRRLDFNRPFVFAVADLKTGLPLFIGTLESPGK